MADEIETQALIDTGFEGDLALPRLRLPPDMPRSIRRSFRVGDGRVIYLASYPGTVEFVDVARTVPIAISIGTPEILIGRGVLNHFRVTFDHGREVMVEP